MVLPGICSKAKVCLIRNQQTLCWSQQQQHHLSQEVFCSQHHRHPGLCTMMIRWRQILAMKTAQLAMWLHPQVLGNSFLNLQSLQAEHHPAVLLAQKYKYDPLWMFVKPVQYLWSEGTWCDHVLPCLHGDENCFLIADQRKLWGSTEVCQCKIYLFWSIFWWSKYEWWYWEYDTFREVCS